KNELFEVAAFADQVADAVAMGDARDVLLDDRAVIENLGRIMGRGPDQFDAAGVSLVIRPSARKSRKKRVVNVDDRPAERPEKFSGQDLHVASHDDELDPMIREDLELQFFRGVLSAGRDRHMMKREAVVFSGIAQGVVIGNDAGDVSLEFSRFPAKSEVVKTV